MNYQIASYLLCFGRNVQIPYRYHFESNPRVGVSRPFFWLLEYNLYYQNIARIQSIRARFLLAALASPESTHDHCRPHCRGGIAEVEVKESKDLAEDALNSTRAAVEEGIFAGGGVALLHAGRVIGMASSANDDRNVGVSIVRRHSSRRPG